MRSMLRAVNGLSTARCVAVAAARIQAVIAGGPRCHSRRCNANDGSCSTLCGYGVAGSGHGFMVPVQAAPCVDHEAGSGW